MVTWSKILPIKGSGTGYTHVKYKYSKQISNVKVFKKIGQTPRGTSQGKKKCWYSQESLLTRNAYVKYQTSSNHCSNVINKVKVSDRLTE